MYGYDSIPHPPEPVDPLIGPSVRSSGTCDGTGAGDHDPTFTFVFGHPRGRLTTLDQARLTVLRGLVLDATHDRTVRFGGDVDWVTPTPSGLLVPYEPKEASDA